MKSFSERQGIKQVADVVQVGAMNHSLRNSLWNVLDSIFWSAEGFMFGRKHYAEGEIMWFSRILWADYLKLPVDSRPPGNYHSRPENILASIREYFFSCEWNDVYDLIQFLADNFGKHKPQLVTALNRILQREMAGYTFIDGILVDITDPQEKQMLAEALADTRFVPVRTHLETALRHLADREEPDYRNSIKESVSAVEAMARVVSGNPKATLGDALKVLEKSGHLHQSLKEGFSKLYGYTNDADGIRHAMLDTPGGLRQADAKYFLLSCTSFINYLKANLPTP